MLIHSVYQFFGTISFGIGLSVYQCRFECRLKELLVVIGRSPMLALMLGPIRADFSSLTKPALNDVIISRGTC